MIKWNLQVVIINALRRAYRTYPVYKQVLNVGKEEYTVKSKKGLPMRRVRWQCVKCDKKINSLEKVIDHIMPVIDPSVGFVDYQTYINRLFCDIDNLQILCKPCHTIKTNAENKIRRNKGKA